MARNLEELNKAFDELKDKTEKDIATLADVLIELRDRLVIMIHKPPLPEVSPATKASLTEPLSRGLAGKRCS